jgi:hypothetical protein
MSLLIDPIQRRDSTDDVIEAGRWRRRFDAVAIGAKPLNP